MPIYALDDTQPEFEDRDSTFIAPDATVIGNVSIGAHVGLWFGVVIRGDNERITIGARTNLHRVWDSDVVAVFGDGAGADRAVAAVITPARRKAWTAGTPADWANEAHAIARDRIYPALRGRRSLRLPGDYSWRQRAVTQTQLAKAGVRLAWILDTVLK